ncbi:MAG: hypothetical protein LBC72_05520, partial [Spirochaetaceae bacterium]|nr:hypothetical protein [Spirochaetaceae bacterium]
MPPPLPLALARIQAALDDQTCVFVFPSESAAQAYADTVLERGVSTPGGVCAVRLDRFIAWDTFKLSAIKTAAPLQTASPSAGATPLQTATPGTATPLIRKLFAAAMLEENAARKKAGGAAYFGALIPPAYAAYSPAFASWIAGMLPQLALWQEAAGGRTADGESADLLVLFGLYRQFLDDNNLFESAWERPPFIRQDGRRYIIFFPEIIPDYAGYQALLEAAGEYIQTVNIPPPPHPPRAFFYQNARSEITDAARYILRLAEQGAAWHDIVVGVPENGDYLPHLKSEFFNRNIPYTDKNGKKLNEYPAGRLFSGILECYTQNFAFEPLVNLLSNAALPWKERGQIDKLIAFGLENNCVCGWEEDGALVDVWKTARFSSEDISVFYTDLKTAILRLCHAKTLSAVKKSYFAFRDRFLDRDGGGAASDTTDSAASADAVIARCVAELAALEQVCKTYPSIAPASPFSFWVKHLAETVYTARSDGGGVGLCSYRIAAALPAAYHVVVGANQA